MSEKNDATLAIDSKLLKQFCTLLGFGINDFSDFILEDGVSEVKQSLDKCKLATGMKIGSVNVQIDLLLQRLKCDAENHQKLNDAQLKLV